MENKERNLITIDLSGCKNWNECEKVVSMITSGKIKIKTNNIKL
jgi:hypothetical protein